MPDADGMCRRVELNAMTSRQLVDLLEQKLTDHGCAKVLPENGTLAQHARRLLEAKLTKRLVDHNRAQITKEAARIALPTDLDEQVIALLDERHELSWDAALAEILGSEPYPHLQPLVPAFGRGSARWLEAVSGSGD